MIGFTLAEVLITLTIIGIVAAITLPSLLVNVNDKAWNAQRKALYARMSQAIGEMDSVSGYGLNIDDENETARNASEAFIIEGLSKVYRVQNICNVNNMQACGIPSSVITMDGESRDFPKHFFDIYSDNREGIHFYNPDAAAFETVNGESIAVFYNPGCISENPYAGNYIGWFVCANMVYDLNGLKGPNEVGKDVGFMTVFYNSNSVVAAPIPASSDLDGGAEFPINSNDSGTLDAASACVKQDEDTRLPDKYELMSLYVNKVFIGNLDELGYWSGSASTVNGKTMSWVIDERDGEIQTTEQSGNLSVRCIKR